MALVAVAACRGGESDPYVGGGGGGIGHKCADRVSASLDETQWDTHLGPSDFESPAAADAYVALNDCACVKTAADAGCADLCTGTEAGATISDFCDGTAASNACATCIHDSCTASLQACLES